MLHEPAVCGVSLDQEGDNLLLERWRGGHGIGQGTLKGMVRCRLRIPRRPAWRREQSPEEVDAQERAAFLAWRRELAAVEATELLVLTPFEKNLEVWRQFWRVLERSHIIVQARLLFALGTPPPFRPRIVLRPALVPITYTGLL